MKPSETFDRVLDLAWSVIDGVATEEDCATLAELVRTETTSRQKYLEAVMLDANLRQLLGPEPKEMPPTLPVQQSQFRGGLLPAIG